MEKSTVRILPDNTSLGMRGIRETEVFLLGHLGNVFAVIWKSAPTVAALDQVFGEFDVLLKEYPSGAGMMIVSLFRHESPTSDANRRSAEIARKLSRSILALAMVEGGSSFWSKINRVALRAAMATVSTVSAGPKANGFFGTHQEAVAWIISTLSSSNELKGDAGRSLLPAVNWMIQRCAQAAPESGSVEPPRAATK
jgi:hypothetical protein